MPDPVAPWVQKAEPIGPKTHALVVGCSSYANLPAKPGPPDDPDRITFGLGQVQTPATSAWQFATWLRDSYRPSEAPLGSIRLLLSPSEAERRLIPDLPSVQRADRPTVSEALEAWYRDCNTDPTNVAIMYAAGHGIQMTKDEGGIVLLEDFAGLKRTPLDGSLDMPAVRAGMYGDRMARQQFYFVDACQVTAPEAATFGQLGRGASLGSPKEGRLTCSMVVSSSAPGTTAFGAPGKGTFFSLALRDCLNGYVAERVRGTNSWGVTTAALMKSVPARVRQLAAERGKEQEAQVGGLVGDAVFHLLATPPLVPFTLHVSPERAAKIAFARLVDARQKVIFERKPVIPAPLTDTLPAGVYTVSLSVDPATPPFSDFSESFPVDPPAAPLSLNFE